MSSLVAVDLEQERASALERQQRRIAGGLRDFRAIEVLETAAPAKSPAALRRVANKRYRRLPKDERELIVVRAVELAGGTTEALDPLRAEPKIKTLHKAQLRPTNEGKVTMQPTKPLPQTAQERLQEPIRAIIAPMLEETPTLTPAEAKAAVEAAGIRTSKSIFTRIWLDYLGEVGLNTDEYKRARASRAAKLRVKREIGNIVSPIERLQKRNAEANAAPTAPQATTAAPSPAEGIRLDRLSDGRYRLQLDTILSMNAARAFRLAAVIAGAIDAALDDRQAA